MNIEKAIDVVCQQTNLDKVQLTTLMQKEIDDLHGLIDQEAGLALVAKRLQIQLPELSDDNTILENSNPIDLWDDIEEGGFIKTPFTDWSSGIVVIRITKPIKEYVPKQIKSNFGITNCIEIEVQTDEDAFEVQKLKIDSKRIRKALIELPIEKYPVIVQLTRLGSGYKTQYQAKILEHVKQTNLQVKKGK